MDAADRRSIDDFRARELAAANRGDVEALVSLRADDFVAYPPNQPAVEGIAAFREWIAEAMERLEWSWMFASARVVVAGDWAFDRGTYEALVRPKAGGKAMEDRGKYLFVLRRDGESWKLAVAMWNSSLEGGAG